MKTPDPLPHPPATDLLACFYGELSPETHQQVASHLETCAECRGQVATWRDTLAGLDAWRLPVAQRSPGQARRYVRWGLAAALLLGVGLSLGRLAAGRLDPGEVRAQLLPALRQELAQEFRQELNRAVADTSRAANTEARRLVADAVQNWAGARQEDRQVTLALLERAERQRKADQAVLRRDLETVAIVADARLQNAQEEIGHLASYTQTGNEPLGGPALPGRNP